MWFRNKQHDALFAEIVALKTRVQILESFALDLCDHIEAAEKGGPRIASLLQKWTPDASRPM
jgi:hypothetical protein